jgi:hypothetical protein
MFFVVCRVWLFPPSRPTEHTNIFLFAMASLGNFPGRKPTSRQIHAMAYNQVLEMLNIAEHTTDDHERSHTLITMPLTMTILQMFCDGSLGLSCGIGLGRRQKRMIRRGENFFNPMQQNKFRVG